MDTGRQLKMQFGRGRTHAKPLPPEFGLRPRAVAGRRLDRNAKNVGGKDLRREEEFAEPVKSTRAPASKRVGARVEWTSMMAFLIKCRYLFRAIVLCPLNK